MKSSPNLPICPRTFISLKRWNKLSGGMFCTDRLAWDCFVFIWYPTDTHTPCNKGQINVTQAAGSGTEISETTELKLPANPSWTSLWIWAVLHSLTTVPYSAYLLERFSVHDGGSTFKHKAIQYTPSPLTQCTALYFTYCPCLGLPWRQYEIWSLPLWWPGKQCSRLLRAHKDK